MNHSTFKQFLNEAKESYVFYHGTQNSSAIEKEGFKINGTGGHRNSSGPYGEGIYLAPSLELAKNYAKGKDGDIFKVTGKLNLKHMSSTEWTAEMKSDQFQTWYKAQSGSPDHLISKWYADQGYDGIFIKISSMMDQAVIYTPNKLTVQRYQP